MPAQAGIQALFKMVPGFRGKTTKDAQDSVVHTIFRLLIFAGGIKNE
jgi:hypothetical protein